MKAHTDLCQDTTLFFFVCITKQNSARVQVRGPVFGAQHYQSNTVRVRALVSGRPRAPCWDQVILDLAYLRGLLPVLSQPGYSISNSWRNGRVAPREAGQNYYIFMRQPFSKPVSPGKAEKRLEKGDLLISAFPSKRIVTPEYKHNLASARIEGFSTVLYAHCKNLLLCELINPGHRMILCSTHAHRLWVCNEPSFLAYSTNYTEVGFAEL